MRGVPSDEFYLILEGKVVVVSGQEGFIIELGPFNYLGSETLTTDIYIPDFSAKVINYAKLIKIRRVDYLNAVS